MEKSFFTGENVSKTSSPKSIEPVISHTREKAGTQHDPIQNIIQRSEFGVRGPSLESLALELSSLPAAQRMEAAQYLQRTKGNGFVQRLAVQMRTSSGDGNGYERDRLQGQWGQDALAAGSPETKSGILEKLKAGVEKLSGLSVDDVRVHYNSPKPEGLQAFAYTQGNQIYMAPGKESHLPHEFWHDIQQKQGRVSPRFQMKDSMINDDASLEKEASVMGSKALAEGQGALPSDMQNSPPERGASSGGHRLQNAYAPVKQASKMGSTASKVVQRWLVDDLKSGKTKKVIAGEKHRSIDQSKEKRKWSEYGINLFYENEPITGPGIKPDPPILRALQIWSPNYHFSQCVWLEIIERGLHWGLFAEQGIVNASEWLEKMKAESLPLLDSLTKTSSESSSFSSSFSSSSSTSSSSSSKFFYVEINKFIDILSVLIAKLAYINSKFHAAKAKSARDFAANLRLDGVTLAEFAAYMVDASTKANNILIEIFYGSPYRDVPPGKLIEEGEFNVVKVQKARSRAMLDNFKNADCEKIIYKVGDLHVSDIYEIIHKSHMPIPPNMVVLDQVQYERE